MGHPTEADELFEIFGDELGAVVTDDSRCLIREFLFGALEDRLNILFGHRFSNLPVHNEPAVTVQDAAHVVKSAAQVQV